MYNNAYVPLPADFRRRSLGDAFGIHATAHMQRMNAMAGDITHKYSGVLDCFVKTFRAEGLTAFYSGFIPNFARLGSWNAVMFLTVEQV